MSKREKSLQRLINQSADLTWDEAVSIMTSHRFVLLTGSGSSRKFVHTLKRIKVFVHRPHPGNIVKQYAQEALLEGLRSAGEIK